jgi:hypothetical protein
VGNGCVATKWALVKHLAVLPGTADLSEKAYPNILTWWVLPTVLPLVATDSDGKFDSRYSHVCVKRSTILVSPLRVYMQPLIQRLASVSISWRGMSRKPLIWFDSNSKLAISFRVYYLKRVKLAWTLVASPQCPHSY